MSATNTAKLRETLAIGEGTNRDLLLKRLNTSFGKPVPRDQLKKSVYGSKAAKISPSAFNGVLNGLEERITTAKAPYKLVRENGAVALMKRK